MIKFVLDISFSTIKFGLVYILSELIIYKFIFLIICRVSNISFILIQYQDKIGLEFSILLKRGSKIAR